MLRLRVRMTRLAEIWKRTSSRRRTSWRKERRNVLTSQRRLLLSSMVDQMSAKGVIRPKTSIFEIRDQSQGQSLRSCFIARCNSLLILRGMSGSAPLSLQVGLEVGRLVRLDATTPLHHSTLVSAPSTPRGTFLHSAIVVRAIISLESTRFLTTLRQKEFTLTPIWRMD